MSNASINKLALAGGAVAGGGVTLVVADKVGLSPTWAGVATGGAAMAGTSLVKSPMWRDALLGASLGGMGVAGVQMLAGWYAKRQHAAQPQQGATKSGKRQADGSDFALPQTGGYVTRQELNDTLAKLADKNADQHKQTCDLMTVLHEEIKKVVAGEDEHTAIPSRPQTSQPVRTQQAPGGVPHLYPLYPQPQSRGAALDDERNAYVDDEYMRNAYAVEDERNAYVDDEYMRNAYGDDERNAYGDDERNAYVDDERNAYVDDERNAYVDDERNGEAEQQYAQMTGGSSM